MPAHTPRDETAGSLQGLALWAAACLLAMANFIAVMDMTIANVSLPHIAGALGVSPTQGIWVITAYSVAEAIAVPLAGWLAARFGPVRVLVTAMTCFAVFSALCGLSVSLPMLVGARVLQGLSGGPMIPMAQTLLRQIFPRNKLNTAMTLFAMTATLAPIAGPMVGGWICDQLSWPWLFYITVPIGLAGAVLIAKTLRRYETPSQRRTVDVVGFGLLVAWVAPLQIMLDLGKDHNWFASALICALAIAAAIGFLAFLIWELTEPMPIINLHVFRHRNFAIATVTLCAVFGAFFGVNVIVPLWLQTSMGYTATWAGRATAWGSIFSLVMAPLMPRIVAVVDRRWLVSGGVAWVAAVTIFARAAATPQMDYWHIALPIMLAGLGMPFFVVPLTSLSLSSVEPHEVASAAGLNSFVRTFSAALAASVLGTLWESDTTAIRASLAGRLQPQWLAGDSNPDSQRGVLDRLLQDQAVTLATNHVVWLLGFSFVAGAALIWLAKRDDHSGQPLPK
ncbi:DHA2 family efflux MFS transporter permease subunit [Paludibacterium purpuratum]|uniref:DHA2 family multidrug resistance protein n=1 Tax=Paludibacterium purpuratum TaxID=1144873 RepID=A0A4R7B5Y8_9NEIS|nr:DHA2 family efflux MFS transporter permease subunit [Paludibacterium purpuratum]TDR80038.1 DHA2 family multidrug resistance protein [Paludibacterium purpuratum]